MSTEASVISDLIGIGSRRHRRPRRRSRPLHNLGRLESLPALDRLAPPFERAMKFFVVRTSVAGGFHRDALSEVLCKCNTNLAGIVVLKRDAVLRERIADFRHLVSLYAGDRFFHPAQC